MINKEVKSLPMIKWTGVLDKFITNCKCLPLNQVNNIKNNDDKNNNKNDEFSKEDWINFVAEQIYRRFKIRYNRNVEQGNHSINAYKTLMIYNEFTHIWEEYSQYGNFFASIISSNKNVDSTSESLAQAIMNYLGVKSVLNTIPPAYSGTRYQLFLNGIYDFVEDKFIEAEDVEELEVNGEKIKVEELGFLNKHLHRIIYNHKPKPPIIENPKTKEKWDFREWLLKVNNNNKERAKWLLFLIGICILPNANIGTNVMLVGPSGSGKSTIGSIIKNIYVGGAGSAVAQFDKNNTRDIVNSSFEVKTLGDDHPFRGSLTEETNFVHLSEMNKVKLTERACILYDKFCDNEMEARKMGKNSVVLSPTPTLYMEGTGFPKMETVKNGVERRTFPFKIEPSDDLIDYRVKGIPQEQIFSNDIILQWVVRSAFKTIRKYVDEEDYESIKINMQYFETPEFINEWKDEFVSGGDEISEFYNSVLYPAMEERVVKAKDTQSWLLNESMLYEIYKEFERDRDVPDTFIKGRSSFLESIKAKLERSSFSIEPIKKYHAEGNDSRLGLDLSFLNSIFNLRDDLSHLDYESGEYAKKKKSDWFVIEYEGQ